MQENDTQKKRYAEFAEWGKRGGEKTKKTRPKEYYSEIGKKGGRPRKALDDKAASSA